MLESAASKSKVVRDDYTKRKTIPFMCGRLSLKQNGAADSNNIIIPHMLTIYWHICVKLKDK